MTKLILIHEHKFDLAPNENGGETVSLLTEVFDNGNGEHFVNQHLTLHSYSNVATFHLHGIQLTSENLLNLSMQLRKIERKYKV